MHMGLERAVCARRGDAQANANARPTSGSKEAGASAVASGRALRARRRVLRCHPSLPRQQACARAWEASSGLCVRTLMSVTLLTSHELMSMLKAVAP